MRPRWLGPTLLALALGALAAPATSQAQIFYPGGYGAYGWGGWGLGNQYGAYAAGLGWMAAGQGAYNLQSAQANAINVNTWMHYNEYMYESLRQKQARAIQQRERQSQLRRDAATATQDRLRNSPTISDIQSGAALNVALVELLDPRYAAQVGRLADIPIDGRLIPNIRFRSNTDIVSGTLDKLTNGEPKGLLSEPQFAEAVAEYRKLAAEIHQQIEQDERVKPATLGQFRDLIRTTLERVQAMNDVEINRKIRAVNGLKAMLALCYLFNDARGLDIFMAGIGERKTVSLNDLLGFMQAFNLSFSSAQNPAQNSAYATLYQKLIELRDRAFGRTGTGTLPLDPPRELDPVAADDFFSAMQPDELDYERAAKTPPKVPPAPTPAPAPQP